MAIGLGIVVIIVAIGACIWLATTGLQQIKVLRAELDQTQQQLNNTQRDLTQTRQDLAQTRRELDELKAAAELVAAAPPPLPRQTRSGGLQDLREQLRASHREEAAADDTE